MKQFLFVVFCTLLLLAIFFRLSKVPTQVNEQTLKILFAPIPKFLTVSFNSEVSSLALFLPQKQDLAPTPSQPEIQGKAGLSFDLTTNTMLYQKNAYQRLPMASLTKIMTAIIALEHPKLDDKYTVSQDDLVGEDSMGISQGETYSLEELLYGLILQSGNDAAEVLAHNFPGGRDGFIIAMNEKVQALGLSDTHFPNPTGLQGDGDQYTTAYDLLVITQYALTHFPLFAIVSATVDQTIAQTPTHKAYYLENETNLLTSYPGVKGVKTGYTPEAGLCLVTYLEYGGHHIIGVLLGSDDRRGDMKTLLNYSLLKLNITPPAS